eukprot:15483886-Alexandrium_andersonii.AAC.1
MRGSPPARMVLCSPRRFATSWLNGCLRWARSSGPRTSASRTLSAGLGLCDGLLRSATERLW